MPPLVSEFITLIKDSSLISTIGAVELTHRAPRCWVPSTYNYRAAAGCWPRVVYLTLTLTISHFWHEDWREGWH